MKCPDCESGVYCDICHGSRKIPFYYWLAYKAYNFSIKNFKNKMRLKIHHLIEWLKDNS